MNARKCQMTHALHLPESTARLPNWHSQGERGAACVADTQVHGGGPASLAWNTLPAPESSMRRASRALPEASRPQSLSCFPVTAQPTSTSGACGSIPDGAVAAAAARAISCLPSACRIGAVKSCHPPFVHLKAALGRRFRLLKHLATPLTVVSARRWSGAVLAANGGAGIPTPC